MAVAEEERVQLAGQDRIARLRGAVVELRGLEVAVAREGRDRLVADRGLERAVGGVLPGEDPLVVGKDQARLTGRRIDEGGDRVDVTRGNERVRAREEGLVGRRPEDTGAVVGERRGVEDVERRVGQERVIGVGKQVEVRARVKADAGVRSHELGRAEVRVVERDPPERVERGRATVVTVAAIGNLGMRIIDPGGVDADQAGLVAVGRAAQTRGRWGWSDRRPRRCCRCLRGTGRRRQRCSWVGSDRWSGWPGSGTRWCLAEC